MIKWVAGVIILGGLVLALWMALPHEDSPSTDQDSASTDNSSADTQSFQRTPASVLPADQIGIDERARLLAAIAAGIARSTADAAGLEDASLPASPRGPQARRMLRAFQKSSQRRLIPVIRTCLEQATRERPELASPHNRALITIKGAGASGSLVTGVSLRGPDGDLEADVLQRCVESQVFGMRFEATPDVGNTAADAQTSIFTLPLLKPDDGPALPPFPSDPQSQPR